MSVRIRIGSRDSALAIRQTELVISAIKKEVSDAEIELIPMKTAGDRLLDCPLEDFGGKGLFVKELDIALLEGKIDLAVHSLKDLPMELSEELPVFGCLAREDPRDCLVWKEKNGSETGTLPHRPLTGICIGTSSSRRAVQWCAMYPETQIKSIRGNIPTRLRKLKEQDYDGIILAYAGLKRLGWEDRADYIFDPEIMVPAAGQGILAVQGRKDYDTSFLTGIFDADASTAAKAERAFIRTMGGGCQEPMGAYARIQGDEMTLYTMYADGEGHVIRKQAHGSQKDALLLGKEAALSYQQETGDEHGETEI